MGQCRRACPKRHQGKSWGRRGRGGRKGRGGRGGSSFREAQLTITGGGGGGGCKVNVIFKEPPILYLESSGFTLIFNFLMVKFSFLWN